MAIYRKVQTTFWTDPWVMELTPEKKYFYLYLLTNDKVKQCGIYEIPLRKMEFETGYNRDTILLFLSELQKMSKIVYNLETNEICVINFSKYNFSSSPKVQSCIAKEFKQVKDKKLIQYLYGIDSLFKDYQYSMDTESQEKQEEKQKEKEEQKEGFLFAYGEQIENILSFFGFTSDSDKKDLLLNTLEKLAVYPENLKKFFAQTEAYFEYKSLTPERKHSFLRFLGTNEPGGVLEGGWNSENWIFKLNELKKDKLTPCTQISRSYEDDRL